MMKNDFSSMTLTSLTSETMTLMSMTLASMTYMSKEKRFSLYYDKREKRFRCRRMRYVFKNENYRSGYE